MARYKVRGPDGAVHVFEGPDDATPEQIEAFAAQTFGQQAPAPAAAAPSVPAVPADSRPAVVRALGNLGAGAIRGAGSIGATLLWPIDKATDIIKGDRGPTMSGMITGQQPMSRNEERRQGITGGLQALGFDVDSGAFAAGKIGGEVAGTLGVGGALANTAARVPGVAAAAPRMLEALRTGGMAAGARAPGIAGRAADLGIRTAGGAIGGGAAAGLVDPGDALVGAGVGAALPGVVKAAGALGSAAGGAARAVFGNPQARSGRELAQALDLADPAAVQQAIGTLRNAGEIVPGARPTAAQALQTPQAGVLQRVLADSRGGGAIQERLAAQNAARLAALERVAPTVPQGHATARQDLGEAVAQFAMPARAAAHQSANAAFDAIDPNRAVRMLLPREEWGRAIEDMLGAGTVGQGQGARQILAEADRIGTMQLPALAPTTAGRAPQSLAAAVRRDGGMNTSALGGELAGLRGQGLAGLTRRGASRSVDQMAERMREAGYLGGEGGDDLVQALRAEAEGRRVFSTQMPPDRQWRAAQEAAMGPPPAAESIPVPVDWRAVQNLRTSINDMRQKLASKPGSSKEVAALTRMHDELVGRIEDLGSGRFQAGEAMPEEVAMRWRDANEQFAAFKRRFDTGPQGAIFRQGADGQPIVQGGEVASKFWGNRPGLADDVQSFRRLIADNPRLLGQFRSMVTTEGGSTADAAGRLGIKFAKWVDNMLPGLQKTFDPEQVGMLQRIAQDIRRGEQAAQAGMARGSNTYQNAQNALSLGLLDNPAAVQIAQRVPVVGHGVNWLRDAARDSKARRLAGVLSDAEQAAMAMEAAGLTRAARPVNPALQQLFYGAARSTPVLASDR